MHLSTILLRLTTEPMKDPFFRDFKFCAAFLNPDGIILEGSSWSKSPGQSEAVPIGAFPAPEVYQRHSCMKPMLDATAHRRRLPWANPPWVAAPRRRSRRRTGSRSPPFSEQIIDSTVRLSRLELFMHLHKKIDLDSI